jgi:hypothetical protein
MKTWKVTGLNYIIGEFQEVQVNEMVGAEALGDRSFKEWKSY